MPLNHLAQGCALLRPFGMVKCGNCSEDAPSACLRVPKLSGKCRHPRSGEGKHGDRHSARGKPGRVSRQEKWVKASKFAQKDTQVLWRNAPLRRYVLSCQTTFDSICYKLMHEILNVPRDTQREAEEVPVEVAVVMPPRDLEELVENRREQFGDDREPPPDLETALSGDEDADPEDLESPWVSAPPPMPTSAASSSSALSYVGEPPPKRMLIGQLTEQSLTSASSAPPAQPPPDWRPLGRPALVQNHKQCSHYRRRTPPLNAVKWGSLAPATEEQRRASYAEACAALTHWLSLRPGLLESFASVEACEYPWAAWPRVTDQEISDTHTFGVYFYCKLKQWLPPPRADIDVVSAKSSHVKDRMSTMIHQASMYTLHRTVLRGLHAGPTPGKSGLVGVFTFQKRGSQRGGE